MSTDYILEKLDELRGRIEDGEADREEVSGRLDEIERSVDDFLRPYAHEFQARWRLLEDHLGIQMHYDEVEEEWNMEGDADGGR